MPANSVGMNYPYYTTKNNYYKSTLWNTVQFSVIIKKNAIIIN